MGTNSGSPAYSSPSTTSGSGLGDTSRPGTSGSSMNNENGTGANGGPMASGTSGMSGSRSRMSGNASGSASSDNVRQAQEALQDQGLYKGQVDGKMGPQTKHAITQFQKQKGLKQTAQLDQPTMNDLRNSSMSGSDNSSSSPNSSPSDNSGSGANPGMGGNGPATTQTNPGGQNRSSNPTP
jgi:peptidoglycan hydrolase-like protein with peptidoglycan-binding domain